MRLHFYSRPRPAPTPQPSSKVGRWLRNNSGTTAIEFAIVALPFFMFVLGILGFGLYFFTVTSLEHGSEDAARKVRTGQAQKSNMTVGEFKQLVCDAAGSYIECGKLHVLIQHASTWKEIQPQPCVGANSSMAASTGDSGDVLYDYTGGSSEVVLVTLCYQWDLARTFEFLKLGAGADGTGAAILQAATAFRVEPYAPT
jgi:TadE-like protein